MLTYLRITGEHVYLSVCEAVFFSSDRVAGINLTNASTQSAGIYTHAQCSCTCVSSLILAGHAQT